MTPDQALVAVTEVEVRHPAIADLRVEAQVIDNDETLVIRVSWSAPDRDTGRADNFQRFSRIRLAYANTETVHTEIEGMVREVFKHEFEECFHLRGRRVYEPHSATPPAAGGGGVAVIIYTDPVVVGDPA